MAAKSVSTGAVVASTPQVALAAGRSDADASDVLQLHQAVSHGIATIAADESPSCHPRGTRQQPVRQTPDDEAPAAAGQHLIALSPKTLRRSRLGPALSMPASPDVPRRRGGTGRDHECVDLQRMIKQVTASVSQGASVQASQSSSRSDSGYPSDVE